MSQTFQRYDEEFNTLTKQVKSKFEDNGGGGYKDEETGASTETPSNISAGDMLDQCDELLQQMALEARSSETDAGLKRELLVKVKDSSGKVFRFKGTGDSINKDPQFQKIKTIGSNSVNELNNF